MIEIYYMMAIMVVFVLTAFSLVENMYMFFSTRMIAYLRRIAILMVIIVVCVILFRFVYIDLFYD